MNEASFAIKIGEIETTCTGSEAYLKEQLPVILKFIESFSTRPEINASSAKAKVPLVGDQKQADLAVNSIAAKLDSKTGSDLVLAASYSLTRSSQTSCSRTELLEEMKKATSYYKSTYSKNLSKYLTTLIKEGKLLEQSSQSYALSANTRVEVEAKIA